MQAPHYPHSNAPAIPPPHSHCLPITVCCAFCYKTDTFEFHENPIVDHGLGPGTEFVDFYQHHSYESVPTPLYYCIVMHSNRGSSRSSTWSESFLGGEVRWLWCILCKSIFLSELFDDLIRSLP